MKRNAIVRIIIYSLIIVILLGILLTALGINHFIIRTDSQTDTYTMGAGEVPAREVKNIDIEWAAGSITIEPGDTQTISFSETGGKNAKPMIYRQVGNKLTIEFQASKVTVGFQKNDQKDLVIIVPWNWDCSELNVDAGAVNLTVNGLNANDVELNLGAGNSYFTDCILGELSINSAAGDVTYTGTLYSLDCDTTSGKVSAVFDNVPRTIEFDGVSADLDLTLPADAGFMVEMNTVSASFHSEFDTIIRDDQYICGDGSCRISVDGVSGDVTLRKHSGDRQKIY